MERETRFELATLALARRCSTTELLPQSQSLVYEAPHAGSRLVVGQFGFPQRERSKRYDFC